MVHRIVFIVFFLISLVPNTFAKKSFKDFHKELAEGIEKTKDNEHIYRKGRKPASVEMEYEWEEEVQKRDNASEELDQEHDVIIKNRNMYQNSTGLSNW